MIDPDLTPAPPSSFRPRVLRDPQGLHRSETTSCVKRVNVALRGPGGDASHVEFGEPCLFTGGTALEFNALTPNFEDVDGFEYLSQVLPEQREGSQTHDQEHEGPPHGRDSLQNQFKSVWLH